MKRYDAIKRIVEAIEDEIIICNIGAPSRELFNIKDRDKNFYMLGSMGLASSIAFGIAISKPLSTIWCIDGDGSILMNLGSLSTIANNHPKNLTLIVIDNGSYGSSGDQKTYTSKKTKLEIIAKGAGFESITVISIEGDIISILKDLGKGCHFVKIEVSPGNAQVKNIPLNPEEIKQRFMESISK
ncbi:MAG: sulfopyruvate decarboxylase subunit beta [Promethearchaeota archaeon]|jgi:sulfopyruvate decarboxylase subunit beta